MGTTSPKRAVVYAFIAVVAALVTALGITLIATLFSSAAQSRVGVFLRNVPVLQANLLLFIITLSCVVSLLVACIAFGISHLNESLVGQRRILRWGLVGVMYALLIQVQHLLPPSNWFILDRLLDGLVQAGAVSGAYAVAFKLRLPQHHHQSFPDGHTAS